MGHDVRQWTTTKKEKKKKKKKKKKKMMMMMINRHLTYSTTFQNLILILINYNINKGAFNIYQFYCFKDCHHTRWSFYGCVLCKRNCDNTT
jgi:hypothetical protein